MVEIYRKRIQIAPVGFEIDRVVIPAIEAKAEKVYLVVHKDRSKDKATKYAAAIQRKLKAANIETELVYCDWENIEEITRVARDLILKESSNEVAINLASGSKNHAIGLDRACMTFRKRKHIHTFYPEAKKWTAWKYPKQQSTGVKKIKQVSIHRIIVPEPELIQVLKIIKRDQVDIPMQNGLKGMPKKDLVKAIYGDVSKQNYTKLQRNITQPLKNTWQAIGFIEKKKAKGIGKEWIFLKDEGTYLAKILHNEETY